jgi:hypothetical protein
MRPRVIFLGLIALASLAASVVGAAPRGRIAVVAPQAAATGLRGSQTAAGAPTKAAPKTAAAVPAAPPVTLALRQSEAAPGASRDEGGQCRLTCAHSYYFCLAGEDAPSCPTSWTSCLADCGRAPIAP